LQYLIPILSLVLIAGLVILIKLKTYSFLVYSLIIFVEGFISAAFYNMILGNEMINVSNSHPAKIDLYTTIIASTSGLTTGLSQLMIGLYMSNSGSKDSYEGVFVVLIVLSVLAFLTMTIRSYSITNNLLSE
jgi:hypothetical protein